MKPHGLKPVPARRSALRHVGVAPHMLQRACLAEAPALRKASGGEASRRQAEPSEAYPTALFQSFEGYPLRIHRPTP